MVVVARPEARVTSSAVKVQVAPAGAPEQLRATASPKVPPWAVTPMVKIAGCPAVTVRDVGEEVTPRVVRSAHWENSEVLPLASVAVAVSTVPVTLEKAVDTVPDPEASVARAAVPRGVWPSPFPAGSHAALEKNSRVKEELGALFKVALKATPPFDETDVRAG
jgi:hypothetical protein